ncbi:MAG: TMEM43 family protein [Planctomycetia bacterium]|nr:TMEM43 family protein [Planctomycetia bacterium]
MLLIIAAIMLLFWNEGRTINRYKTLKQGLEISIPVKSDEVLKENNGKLVYTTGELKTNETLKDSVFPQVSVNALKLNRKVEMYQWEETITEHTEKNLGGSTTTTKTASYSKKWSDKLINSSTFMEAGHDNPVSMPYESGEQFAKFATLGEFDATALIPLTNNVKTWKPEDHKAETATETVPAVTPTTTPTETTMESSATADIVPTEDVVLTDSITTPAPTAEATSEVTPQGTVIPATTATTPNPTVKKTTETIVNTVTNLVTSNAPAAPQISGNYYYFGQNPATPSIGDIRISFTYVPNGPVSVVAGQLDGKLVTQQLDYGTLLLLAHDTVSKEKMFADAQKSNTILAWILRGLGFILVMVGLNMIFKPLSVLADVIPILGSLVGGATGIVTFLLAAVISLVTIGISWLYFRPIIGIPLLVAALVMFLFSFKFGKKKNK